ncbi:unnamed protein product [Discosporangium mesarthrocarpum]
MRPDLSSSVLQLSYHMNAPTKRHYGPAKRTLRFSRSTTNLSTVYQRGSFNVRGYADAAYISHTAPSKSMERFIFFLGNAALSWSAHRQSVVTCSSTEGEVVGPIEATSEAKFSTFPIELRRNPCPASIMEDNKGAADLAEHGAFFKRSKRIIVVRVPYMNEQVNLGEMKVIRVSTHD